MCPNVQRIILSWAYSKFKEFSLRFGKFVSVNFMMGNEKSQPAGLSIDEVPTEVTESWTLHGATYSNGNIPKISVFVTTGIQPSKVSHLERFTKVKAPTVLLKDI